MSTKILVTSVDGNQNFKSRTYTDANPNASNATLNQFARKIGSISTNTIVNVTRVDLDDITGAVAGPLKTFTWTTNYFAPTTLWKQNFMYPLNTNADNIQDGVSVTSATLDGTNAVFELSSGDTVTQLASNVALNIYVGSVSIGITFGDFVTIFNATDSGATFAEILNQKLTDANYNFVVSYDSANSAYKFENYTESSINFSIATTALGGFVNRWLYEEYNGTYPTGISISRMSNPMSGTIQYILDIEI